MVSRSNHCDPSRLRSLLSDRLPEEEQDELAEHLEHCATCRRTLEGLAAARQWWTDIRRFSGTDDPLISSVSPFGTARTEVEERADEESAHRPRLPFLAPSKDPGHLGRLGPYEVTEIIGQGGMGLVLKAHDPALHRVVAIKVLAPELATSASARRRFAREAQAAAAVAHDHVVLIHAVDSAQGLPYLVMAYIPGKSLQERIERHGPLEVTEILRIGMQAASGLAAAHAQGLVHRDVKPANILLENGVERVKLTDFGLARAVDDASLTQSGVVTGTPQYMAPEQARGEAVDHRADLFSLGSVLYAMCTGHSPFRAETTMAVLRRVSEEPARALREINPEIPDWLAAIIAKLHAKDPAERYQSAAEVADVLSQWLAYVQQPNQAPPPFPLPEKTSAPRPRRFRPWAVAALALLGLAAGLGATEAVGVTHVAGFVATVLRIKTPGGTLVLKVDDPSVKVRIDGEDVVITGAGPEEVRVSPGKHEVRASRPGQPERIKIVSISRGGKQLIDLSREAVDDPDVMRSSAKAQAELLELRERTKKLEAKLAHREEPVDEAQLIRLRESLRQAHSNLEAAWRDAAKRNAQSRDDPTVRRNLEKVNKLEAELDRLEALVEKTRLDKAKSMLSVASRISRTFPDPAVQKYQEQVDKLEAAQLSRLDESLRQAQDRLDRARRTARHEGDSVVVQYRERVKKLEAELARREPAEPAEPAEDATLPQLRRVYFQAQARLNQARRLGRSEDDPAVVRCRELVAKLEARISEIEPIDEEFPPGPFVSGAQPPSASTAHSSTIAMPNVLTDILSPGSAVWCVTFSPDGKRLAAATSSSDRAGRLWVWELRPGEPPRFELAYKIPAPVRSLAFAPDGKTLACVEFRGRVKSGQGRSWDALRTDLTLRDPESGAVRARVAVQKKAVVAVAFTPDGRRLVTGSMDKTIKVWDVATDKPLQTLAGHDDGVLCLAIAPDGRTLVSGGKDQAVRIWDLETGEERRVLRGHSAGVESLAFTPDGKTLATTGTDQTVRIWDVATGRLRATLLGEGDRDKTLSVACARDSQSVAAGTSDGTLRIWGLTPDDGMPLLKRFRAHERGIYSLAYSPDGGYLATGGFDDSVRLWDARPAASPTALPPPGAAPPAVPPRPAASPSAARPAPSDRRDSQRPVAATPPELAPVGPRASPD